MLIDHGNNRFTKYCHMDTITSKVGDRVGVGTPIGTVGWTAANYIVHLHFAVSNFCGYRSGRCGVGAYCGSSGVLNGAPNTLYQCNSPSGSAAVINSCDGY
jgi:murein DD-endopeptidase MepM/ murein hydrolase activator NlpD